MEALLHLAEQHERIAIAFSTEAVQVAHRIGHVDYEASALLNLAESLTLENLAGASPGATEPGETEAGEGDD